MDTDAERDFDKTWRVSKKEEDESTKRTIEFKGWIRSNFFRIVDCSDNLRKLGCREDHSLQYWAKKLQDWGYIVEKGTVDDNVERHESFINHEEIQSAYNNHKEIQSAYNDWLATPATSPTDLNHITERVFAAGWSAAYEYIINNLSRQVEIYENKQ
jgi:hypothetical protein